MFLCQQIYRHSDIFVFIGMALFFIFGLPFYRSFHLLSKSQSYCNKFQPLFAQNKSAFSVFFNQRMHFLFCELCNKTNFQPLFAETFLFLRLCNKTRFQSDFAVSPSFMYFSASNAHFMRNTTQRRSPYASLSP